MNTISSWLVRFKFYKNAFRRLYTSTRHKTNYNEDVVCGAKCIQIWKAAMSQNRAARSSWFHEKAHDATPKLPAYKSVHLFIDFYTSIRNERWLSCTVLPFTVHRTSTHAKWRIYLSLFLIGSYYSFTSMKILKANVFLWSYILLSALLILNCHYAHINTPDTSGYLRF